MIKYTEVETRGEKPEGEWVSYSVREAPYSPLTPSVATTLPETEKAPVRPSQSLCEDDDIEKTTIKEIILVILGMSGAIGLPLLWIVGLNSGWFG